MWTIVVGDGLTREYLSSDVEYAGRPQNVGRHEAERLLGRGGDAGRGPLSSFLQQVATGRRSGASVGIVLLSPRQEQSARINSDGETARSNGFVEPVASIADHAEVIHTSDRWFPWAEFGQAVARMTGTDPTCETVDRQSFRFVVVGCHTEHRVLSMACFLRNVLGFPSVATCTHLTGSATPEAYYSALRHNCPSAGIRVFVDLRACASFAGIEMPAEGLHSTGACDVEPPEIWNALTDEQRSIIRLLCMHWTRAHLRLLQGGYSGSALLLANGWKGQAKTEPLVLKIDRFSQMRREIDGYHQVKDFLGKHVPKFDYPVSLGESVGVSMEFASMEGDPATLQDTFEAARTEQSAELFYRLLQKSLRLLTHRLYANTRTVSWVTPYRALGLHAEAQLQFLHENVSKILEYAEAESHDTHNVSSAAQLAQVLEIIAANEGALESEVCLCHGDLNLQNIICDGGDNIWFIDWTHSGHFPIELDFAKLESDVKFVLSKDFDTDDLPRVKRFEEYLLANRLPAAPDELPDKLNFARWDLRFRKILGAVRMIREACFAIKATGDWCVYRIALLRYALHTLSFDKRQGRGECEFPQLMHALYSSQDLLLNLLADEFHLSIRSERPESYPHRQRISIDVSLWQSECPGYDPPYHVDPVVLNSSTGSGGWADPEDVQSVADRLEARGDLQFDDQGRPLNPRGRTGIAGRGLLGLWGPNPSIAGIVTRTGSTGRRVDILLGQVSGGTELELPKSFARPGETPSEALARILADEAGWELDVSGAMEVFDGYVYDPRQTDHAWVEIRAELVHLDFERAASSFVPGGQFEDVRWCRLDSETINRLPAGQAAYVREAVKLLARSGALDESRAKRLLEKTG